MLLYKFLAANHALDDTQKHRLKISLFGTLNDPYDLMSIAYTNIEVGRAVQATKDRPGEKSGILCFSSDWKDPVIWTHYADTHQGIPPVPTMLRQKSFDGLSYAGRGRNRNEEGRQSREWRGECLPPQTSAVHRRLQAPDPCRG